MFHTELLIRLCEAQNHRCAYCSLPIKIYREIVVTKSNRATKDHVISKARGGNDDWDNYVAACIRCNELKGAKNAYGFFERVQRLLATLDDISIWHTCSKQTFNKLTGENERRKRRKEARLRWKKNQIERAKHDPEIAFQIMKGKLKRKSY